MTKRNIILIVVAAVFLLALTLLWSLIDLVKDWLFFAETGYTPVFTRTLSAKIGPGAFFGLALAAFVLINAAAARKAALPRREFHFGEGTIRPFTTEQADRFPGNSSRKRCLRESWRGRRSRRTSGPWNSSARATGRGMENS